MNKNAIKKFAIEARKKLIDSVTDKAGMLGITEKSCSEPITKGADFEVYQTVAGTEVTLNKRQCEQRRRLVSQIESRGFEAVVEEVAYTWFNRICAIRFMEVNDYLPNRVRVLSSEKEGKMEPDLVTQAPDVDLDLTAQEKEEIINWKMSGTSEDTDKMFGKLFLKQCHQLHDILPGLFEADSDYMELLFGISYTNKDDVIYMLVNPETGIPEADFNVSTLDDEGNPTGQVEIIGWLYQYYNTELKDDTFAKLKKNVKITKERIPAATQLFTPDWIVRYMVENSVGRIWIEHLRAVDPSTDEKATAERFGWKYYLPEAEQEESVNVKLAEIRTSYKDLKPTDITCIDPCMGSGHILIAMFDVLMDIYESAGYDKREAAFEIVEHNIHGLDIDQRAYQLAYFAVMMKGRGYNRRFLRGRDGKPEPKVYAIVESNEINRNHLQFFGTHLSEMERNLAVMQIEGLLDTFKDAREYGSILNVDVCDWDVLEKFVDDLGTTGQISFESVGSEETQKQLRKLVRVAKNLGLKYDVVVTNPPYMGASGMGTNLAKYVKDKYPKSKADLFSVFIERGNKMLKKHAYNCMVTMQSWMFLSSFEELRKELLENITVVNLMHMENMVMGIAFGTAVSLFKNSSISRYRGFYHSVKLCNVHKDRVRNIPIKENNNNCIENEKFERIPTMPIAYWVSDELIHVFENKSLSDMAEVRTGLQTGNNNKYLRLWYEVPYDEIDFDATSDSLFTKKWYPHTKGGNYRKWYGNYDYVINWKNNGAEIKNEKGSVIRSPQFYFKDGITWSHTTSGGFSGRELPEHFIINVESPTVFNAYDKYYIMAILNSAVGDLIFQTMNSTMHYLVGNVSRVPIIIDNNKKEVVEKLVKECISLSKEDWDEKETSWGYKTNPLLVISNRYDKKKKLRECMQERLSNCENRFETVYKNEYELNQILIQSYGLENDISGDIEKKNITIYSGNEQTEINELLSFFVGCIFGRYSLDSTGIKKATNGIEFIILNQSNILKYDVMELFCDWLKRAFGELHYTENMKYISEVLGGKSISEVDVIRNYFMKDFYKNHRNQYSITGSGERPIYWMFESGKNGAFRTLIYCHAYTRDTIGELRTECLHKVQTYIEYQIQVQEHILETSTSTNEKAKVKKMFDVLQKQLQELLIYDEAVAHVANMHLKMDLNDGVKANYELFQNVEVAHEGMKIKKIDLLAAKK